MKNIYVAALIAVAVLTTCAGAVWWFVWPVYLTENRVKLVLSDPDSAKFDKVLFNRKTGASCGYVNSKNKMGGYVGSKHFVATENGEVRFEPRLDTKGKTTEELLIETDKQIAYLEFAIANCHKARAAADFLAAAKSARAAAEAAYNAAKSARYVAKSALAAKDFALDAYGAAKGTDKSARSANFSAAAMTAHDDALADAKAVHAAYAAALAAAIATKVNPKGESE